MNFWEGYSEFEGTPLALQKAKYLEIAMRTADRVNIGISSRHTRPIMVRILRELHSDPAMIEMKRFLVTVIKIHNEE